MTKILEIIDRAKVRITRDSITASGFATVLVFAGFIAVLLTG